MKHLFAIAVFLLAACSWAVGDTASDERELTQLVNDFNAAIVSRTSLSWSGSWPRTTSIIARTGMSRPARSTWRIARAGSVDFDSLVADEINVRVYGDTAIVTYRSTAKGKDQDGAIDEQRRWTRVFVRKDGRWQLVHSQGTTIQKP